ncbi:M23 family metallopeptidase [Bradyrhizobium sp. 21]|uniref:M23 family metallopeptidase n=1 Tax=Bradyrhizobium sp. 21 TaxID=2782666 RepID=UPI003211C297
MESAGEGTSGRIAIRDRNGFLHEILHTDRQYVRVGQPVAAGQLIGAMGNVGVITHDGRPGAHHVHYQLKDSAGGVVDPGAFADALGPFDPNPAPPAYVPEYLQYVRDAAFVPEFSRDDVRILRRMPAGSPDRSPFNSKQEEVPYPRAASPLPPGTQGSVGERFGYWPELARSDGSADPNRLLRGQPGIPNNEDWSAMWRRRIGLP